MANFSPDSERNTVKMSGDYMEKVSAQTEFRPGLKFQARVLKTGLKPHVIQPGLKKERGHAHRLCFRTSVNFLMEIWVLRLG